MQSFHLAVLGLAIGTMSSAGCASRKRLVDVPDPLLVVSVPEVPGTAVIGVYPGDASLWSRGPCQLPAVTARAALNGVAFTRRRGPHATDDFMYDRDCVAEFGAPAAAVRRPAPNASIQISDESATWRLELPTALASRAFALVEPGTPLRRGERLELSWSEPSDRFDTRVFGFELYDATSGPGTGVRVHEIEVRDGVLSFTVPPLSKALPDGPSVLRVVGPGGIHPISNHCPARKCVLNIAFSVSSLPVTLEG